MTELKGEINIIRTWDFNTPPVIGQAHKKAKETFLAVWTTQWTNNIIYVNKTLQAIHPCSARTFIMYWIIKHIPTVSKNWSSTFCDHSEIKQETKHYLLIWHTTKTTTESSIKSQMLGNLIYGDRNPRRGVDFRVGRLKRTTRFSGVMK